MSDNTDRGSPVSDKQDSSSGADSSLDAVLEEIDTVLAMNLPLDVFERIAPQVDRLAAVARAGADYVAWIKRPRADKEIESPHAAKGRHLYNVLCAAIAALTAGRVE